MILVHATVVALGTRAVLLRGPSGSGKSDLALRLIGRGAKLVADDQVAIEAEGSHLTARAPAALAGLLEVRGIGIRPVPHVASAEIAFVIDLDPALPRPRLPELETTELAGLARPCYRLDAFADSTVDKVLLLLGEVAPGAPL